jgi:DNA primase
MTPRPAAPELAREDDRQQKLAALRARLHEDAQALRTPGDWATRLRLAALLPGEEFANILLISSQRPSATMVRDYRQWTAAGRQVRRHEKGIETFRIPPRPAPRRPQDRDERDDGEPPPTWRDADRVAYVWDLSQTTGQPLAVAAGLPTPGQAPAGLWDALCWLARREGFAVEREDGAPADGTTFWAARRIRLLPGLTSEQANWALAHQLGHILLHDTPGGHSPGTTTTGCSGMRKAEADSVAYITCARHGVTVGAQLAYPASWAGTDPRAQPAATILAAGHRVTTATASIIRHTDRILHGDAPAPVPAPRQQPAASATAHTRSRQDDAASRQATATPARRLAAPRPPAGTSPLTLAVLRDAETYYTSQLTRSWAPAYLTSRGITEATARDWDIGYAPGGWTALTDHLHSLGHDDREIQAAGLAKLSSRGTLIDIFRDRVMLPVHNADGTLAGFIGRAHPRAGPDVPKYLNSPETAGYRKGSLLFGLHHARVALSHGATPVIVEGPFDAIAVTTADPGRHAGLAPCGTALTSQQAALIGQAADLDRTGILVAFDSDAAGHRATLRAHGILLPLTPKLQTVLLDGKDPAEILQHHGPDTLRGILRDRREPLSAMLIDARIESYNPRLDDPVSTYLALLNVAVLIADLLPQETARQIRNITTGRELQIVDDQLRHVDNPELAEIVRILPADTAYQTVRTAAKLDFDVSDVITVVANAVTLGARSPKGQEPALRDNRERARPALRPEPSRLAGTSFPLPPLSPLADAVRTGSGSRPRPQSSAPRRTARR